MVVSHRIELQQVKMFAFEMHSEILLNEELEGYLVATMNKQITK